MASLSDEAEDTGHSVMPGLPHLGEVIDWRRISKELYEAHVELTAVIEANPPKGTVATVGSESFPNTPELDAARRRLSDALKTTRAALEAS